MHELSKVYSNHFRTLCLQYERILKNHGYEHLIIYSGEPIPIFQEDYHYPFKVNPYFKASIPIDDLPHCWLIFTPENPPILIYHQARDYWHSVAGEPSGFWSEHYQIKIIHKASQAKQFLPKNLKSSIYIGPQTPFIDDWGLEDVNDSKVLAEIDYASAIKSDYEQACIRLATISAVKGHLVAERAFLEGDSENEIHLKYLGASGQNDNLLPYSNIIAINKNSAILHYTDNQTVKYSEAGRLSFLIDAGAIAHGYCSDITRTFAYHDDEFADLIRAMEAMQLACVDRVKAGLDYVELNAEAHRAIGHILREFKIVDMEVDTLLELNLTSRFFPHGLGHFLGTRVHDAGGHLSNPNGEIRKPPDKYPYLRLTRTLEENQVLTIEPGLYFIESLLNKIKESKHSRSFNWDKLEKLIPYGGIRIEDDVIVKKDSSINLTRDVYSELS